MIVRYKAYRWICRNFPKKQKEINCLKIDFSDYKCLTQKDIIKIDNAGI